MLQHGGGNCVHKRHDPVGLDRSPSIWAAGAAGRGPGVPRDARAAATGRDDAANRSRANSFHAHCGPNHFPGRAEPSCQEAQSSKKCCSSLTEAEDFGIFFHEQETRPRHRFLVVAAPIVR